MVAKAYTPSQAMSTNQKRGRAMKKTKTVRSYDSPYTMTAKSFDEDLSLDDVKEVYRFLTKAEKKINKYNVDSDGKATMDYLDFLDGGGSAGLAWAREHLREENILKSFTEEITEDELNTPETDKWDTVKVEKALDEELMQVTYVAMLPDSTDLQGDHTTTDEVRKAHASFSKSLQKANLFHMVMTDTFDVLESYLAPTDFILGEQMVVKGTWLMTLQVYDDRVWSMIKSGEINGISIGALAQCDSVED